MAYQTLNHDHNEIRVLCFNSSPDSDDMVTCSLRVVSLRDITHEFQGCINENQAWAAFYFPPSAPEEAAESLDDWIRRSQHDVASACYHLPRSRYPQCRALAEQQQDTLDLLPRFNWGDFEALSYCWESEALEAEIMLDGARRKVPRNLEAALQALQILPEFKQGMHIWVDFLCIDQANDVEKGHQVRMMREIYAQAMSVIAWLGSDSDDSADVVDLERLEYEHGSPMIFPDGFGRKVASFLSLQYFQRLWIIQELAVNRNMTLFLCGEIAWSRDQILTFCNWVMRHAEHLDETRAMVHTDARSVSLRLPTQEESVWYLAYAVDRLLNNDINAEIDTVLDLGRKASAQKDVDKLYGLLGLMNPYMQENIWPDYSLTADDLYLEFAEALITISESRIDGVLSWAGVDNAGNIPSWVPDWRLKFKRNHLRHLRERNACQMECAPLDCGAGRLICYGIVVDSIDAVGIQSSNLDAGPVNAQTTPPSVSSHCAHPNRYEFSSVPASPEQIIGCHSWLRTTKAVLDCLTIHHGWISPTLSSLSSQDNYKHIDLAREFAYPFASTKYRVLDTPADQWWQRLHQFLRNHADFPVLGRGLKSFFSPAGELQTESHLWQPNFVNIPDVKIMSLNVMHRLLITTETGYLGLAPDHALVGDVIAVLYGCNFPVVLRPVGSTYKYIGECYVHGIMDGEVIDAVERGEYSRSMITLI